MDYSPPGSSVLGIFQARILEWVAMPFSRGSSQPRDRTRVSYVSCIGRWVVVVVVVVVVFTTSATWEASHEIKRHLLLGRKAMTNLDNILKSRDIILLTNIHRAKTMVFPAAMYKCESWTIKKAECQKN